jgi:flagellar hook-associated protein 2
VGKAKAAVRNGTARGDDAKIKEKVTMTISVGGIISGIDTESIISQLLDLERQPILNLQIQEADYMVQLTAYGSLKSVLNSIETTAQGLEAESNLTSFSATSGDTDKFTVSADSSATAGTHNITVKQLAREHMVKSVAFTGTEEILEFKVDANNKFIDFKENGDAEELTATITEGNYTVSELEAEIKSQLEAASDGAAVPNNIDYTVSYDSTTKKFTIEEDGSNLTQLDILWATGTNNAGSASSLLGFDAADDTEALTYTSDNEVGEGTIHLEIGSTFTISSTNNKINFKEIGGTGSELTATLENGTYTISEMMVEIKEQ